MTLSASISDQGRMGKSMTVDLRDKHNHFEADPQCAVNEVSIHRIEATCPNKIDTTTLGTRPNEPSIHRCPQEVLLLIFSIVAARPRIPPFQTSSPGNYPIPRVACISHVCKHWRDVCLNDPRLWTDIDVDLFGKWPTEFIHRSGSAVLNIIAWLDNATKDFVDAVILALPRVQSLRICGNHNELAELVPRLIVAAPLLEAASFGRVSQWEIDEGADEEAKRFYFPKNLFSGQAPCLRDLATNDCCPSTLPMAALTNVTHLSVVYAWTMLDIMRFLSQAANLVALDLGPIASHSRNPSVTLGATIHLPHMTTLKAWALPTIDTALAFLSALDVPHLSELEVSVSATQLVPNDARALIRVLSGLLAIVMKQSQQWHKLTLITEMDLSAEFGAYPEDRVVDPMRDWGMRAPFVVSWTDSSAQTNLNRMWHWTLDILPLDQITSLSVYQGFDPYNQNIYSWAVFKAFKRVTTLRIQTQYPQTVIGFLEAATPEDASHSPDEPAPTCIFPQLAHVVLARVPLQTHDPNSQLLSVLRQFALVKAERSRIDIVFEGCEYSEEVMLALHDTATVTWSWT